MSSTAPLLARTAHLGWVLRHEGVAGVSSRLTRRWAGRVDEESELAIRTRDLLRPLTPEVLRPLRGAPQLTVVMTPPSQLSGGHTTVMRLVEGLTRRGFEVTLALYDAYGSAGERHEATVRSLYPNATARVVNADDGLPESDIVLATSWQTAQVVARSRCVGRRCYLVQDFEPWFYAHGSAYALAEQTYSFGMVGIAIGGWLAARLHRDYGMVTYAFPYACDFDTYNLPEPAARSGIVFYSRPSTPRRGALLGALALAGVRRELPDVPIHVFGQVSGPLAALDVIDHGTVPPRHIAQLYAHATVGLSLSMTDVSLTPMEMLAAGLPAVVNDSPFVRADLGSVPVVYAAATPEALGEALLAELSHPRDPADREALRASVRPLNWERSVECVARALLVALP